jgi:hypothetical protein
MGRDVSAPGGEWAALALDQLRDGWFEQLEVEDNARGTDWETDLDEQRAFQIGLDPPELIFAELWAADRGDQAQPLDDAKQRTRDCGLQGAALLMDFASDGATTSTTEASARPRLA